MVMDVKCSDGKHFFGVVCKPKLATKKLVTLIYT